MDRLPKYTAEDFAAARFATLNGGDGLAMRYLGDESARPWIIGYTPGTLPGRADRRSDADMARFGWEPVRESPRAVTAEELKMFETVWHQRRDLPSGLRAAFGFKALGYEVPEPSNRDRLTLALGPVVERLRATSSNSPWASPASAAGLADVLDRFGFTPPEEEQ